MHGNVACSFGGWFCAAEGPQALDLPGLVSQSCVNLAGAASVSSVSSTGQHFHVNCCSSGWGIGITELRMGVQKVWKAQALIRHKCFRTGKHTRQASGARLF